MMSEYKERDINILVLKDWKCESLFLSNRGQRWNKSVTRNMITRFNLHFKFRYRIMPHIFRHSFINISGGKKCSEKLLIKVVGQKDVKTFMRYRHVVDEEMRNLSKIEPTINNRKREHHG